MDSLQPQSDDAHSHRDDRQRVPPTAITIMEQWPLTGGLRRTAPPRRVRMIGKTIAHYDVTAKLGEGGMGEVYLATDTKLDRQVALKFLPSSLATNVEARERLIREAKAASKLSHPNIVTIYAVEESEGRTFIAMEYVEGRALDQFVAEEKPDPATVAAVAADIAGGLSEAHAAGIVHRDLKPANIIVDRRGRARILDFGVAKLPEATKLTQTGTTVGTIVYMSPEQIQSQPVDGRSDLFSLGAILYEMLAGTPPFGAEHPAAVMYSIINEDPSPLAQHCPGVPPALATVVERLLQKDPAQRFQDAAEVITGLGSTEPVGPAEQPRRARKTKPRKSEGRFSSWPRVVVPAVVAVLIAAVLTIIKPWRTVTTPSLEVSPRSDRLAVLYFDNMADPNDSERLAEIITSLLITDLSASRYVDVVSSHRLYDILKNLGHEGEKRVEPDVATQVAEAADARWMLLGRVLRLQPTITLAADLIEVATGNLVASQRLDGSAGEDVFGLVDRLTVNVKRELSLPEASASEPDIPIATRTTTSEEAFRLYLEGMDLYHKHYSDEANEKFYQAIAIDSNFAMAYYRIATSLASRETVQEKAGLLERALADPGKLNRLERLHIEARLAEYRRDRQRAIDLIEQITEEFPDEKEGWWNRGRLRGFGRKEHDIGVESFEHAIALDPQYKQAYNYLTYQYIYKGDFTGALRAVEKYAELAPDEPNPLDTRGEVYAWFGYLPEAIEAYTEALEINPDFWFSRVWRAHLYFFDHQFDRAESVYQAETNAPGIERRTAARSLLAAIPLYQGQFARGLERLDEGIAADEAEEEQLPDYYEKFVLKSRTLAEMGDTTAAFAALEEGVQKMPSTASATTNRDYRLNRVEKAMLLATQGKADEVDAIATELAQYGDETDSTTLIYKMWGSLLVAAVNGQYDDFEKQVQGLRRFYYWPRSCATLAYFYLALGHVDRAVEEYEKLNNWYEAGRAFMPIAAATAHYYLGLAYEQSGWTDKAIESYEKFLNIWKDCDAGLPKYADARARVERLRGR